MFSVTFYDFKVFEGADQKVHLTGSYVLVRALRYLNSAARAGLLSAEAVVEPWSDIPVPGSVLKGILDGFGQDSAWVVDDRAYTVSLDEL